MTLSKVELVKIAVLVFCLTHNVLSQRTERKVVIIGAGLAGYSAAAKLLENGVEDFVILEAENRIGGRIFSIPYRDGRIDMGAQWVHGQGRNSIYEMIDGHFEFGDTGFDNAYNYFHQSNGQPVNQRHCKLLSILSSDILYESFEEMAEFNHSMGDFFAMKYSRGLRDPSLLEVSWTLARQFEEFVHSVTNNYFASTNWHSISAQLYGKTDMSEGKQWLTWKKQGFATVFDYISKKLPNPTEALDVESKVLLNKTVKNIRWNQDKPLITCSDGSEYSTDHIIFTPSLGVLKARHESLFTPQLPTEKILAIENIAFGSLEKMFLEFSEPFWQTNSTEWVQYSILWTQEDIIAVTGTDREWLIDVTYLAEVESFPNLLSFFLIGQRFEDFDKIDNEKIVDDIMWLLERILGGPVSRPISVNRSTWISQENFLGAYSYLSMDSARNNVSPQDLAEPISNDEGQPKIFFAGEATDAFYSYANGAVSSGWRAGEEVLSNL